MAESGVVTVFGGSAGPLQGVIGRVIKQFASLSASAKGAAVIFAGTLTVAIARGIREMGVLEEKMAELSKLMGSEIAEPLTVAIAQLGTQLPVATDRLLDIAAAASRMGIQGKANILEFVETIGIIDKVTEASAETVATDLARIAAALNLPIEEIRRFADVVDRVADNTATDFNEMIATLGRLARQGRQLDIPIDQLVALAGAANTVNVQITRGATQIRRLMQEMTQAGRRDELARNLRMTSAELSKLIDEDPVAILMAIGRAMAVGGERARQLQETFGHAGAEAAGALRAMTGEFERLGVIAKEELDEGGQLMRQFAEFVDLGSSRATILQNRITELALSNRVALNSIRMAWHTWLHGIFNVIDAIRRVDRELDAVIGREAQASVRSFARQFAQLIVAGDRALGTLATSELAELQKVSKQVEEQLNNVLKDLDEPAAAGVFVKELFSLRLAMEDIGDPTERLQFMLTGIGLASEKAREKLTELQKTVLDFDDDDADPLTPILDALRAFNLEILASELPRLGLQLKDISTAAEANLVVALLRSRIALEDNEFASKIFANAVRSDLSPAIARAAVIQEEYNEQLEAERRIRSERASFFDSEKRRLDMELRLLTDSTASRRRLEIQERDLSEAERQTLLTRLDMIEAIEQRRKREEELGRELEQQEARLRRLRDQHDFRSLDFQMRIILRTSRELSRSLLDTFEALATGADNAGDAVVDMIRRIARELAEQRITSLLFGFLSNFAGGKSGQRSLPHPNLNLDPVPLRRRHGGPISAGMLYETHGLGDREFFMSNVAGKIMTQKQLQGSSAPIVIENHFEINAMDGPSVRRTLMSEMPFLTKQMMRTLGRSEASRRGLS